LQLQINLKFLIQHLHVQVDLIIWFMYPHLILKHENKSLKFICQVIIDLIIENTNRENS